MKANLESRFLDEGLGGADQAARRREQYVLIFMILGFGWCPIEGKYVIIVEGLSDVENIIGCRVIEGYFEWNSVNRY